MDELNKALKYDEDEEDQMLLQWPNYTFNFVFP